MLAPPARAERERCSHRAEEEATVTAAQWWVEAPMGQRLEAVCLRMT